MVNIQSANGIIFLEKEFGYRFRHLNSASIFETEMNLLRLQFSQLQNAANGRSHIISLDLNEVG